MSPVGEAVCVPQLRSAPPVPGGQGRGRRLRQGVEGLCEGGIGEVDHSTLPGEGGKRGRQGREGQ